MEFPKYEHKYLSVFDNNEDYEEQTAVIEECNWSAIRDPNQTDADKKDYYPSVRPTNEDNKYVMNWYSSDELKKKFALEITWGYYGFEWVNYEYNGEILKGGNLYIIKEITKVPTVADGYRLQHINNFINTQKKVTEIEWFDASNIISAINAFYGLTDMLSHVNEWNSLEDATKLFYCVKTINYPDNITEVLMPKLKNCSYMFAGDSKNSKVFRTNVKYSIGTDITDMSFIFSYNTLLLENNKNIDIFKTFFNEPDFKNCLNYSYIFYNNYINQNTNTIHDNYIIDLNLYDGEYDESKILNLSYCFAYIKLVNASKTPPVTINIIHNNKINIRRLFLQSKLFNTKNDIVNFSDINKITDCSNAFDGNTFNHTIPIKQIIPNCNMDSIYTSCTINCPSKFDYAPNNEYYTKNDIIGENIFSNAKINKDFIFKNIDRLYHIYFNNITFSEPIFFNYDLINDNIEYDEPRNITFSGTNITGIKDQELTLTPFNLNNNNYEKYTANYNIFKNCKYIDFTNSNFTINIDINISYYGNNPDTNMFYGCTNMVNTPILKGILCNNGQNNEMFLKCTNLKYINGEDFIIDLYFNNYYLNLSTSPNLIDIKLKGIKGGLNLQNCINININTLYTTLLNPDSSVSILRIMKNVYDQFTDEQKNILIEKITTIEIVENES